MSSTSDKPLNKSGLIHLWSKMVAYFNNLFSVVGNSDMGTTATTLTGAIAEHEQDISDLVNFINGIQIGVTKYSGLKQGGYSGRITVTVQLPREMPNSNYYVSAELSDAYADYTTIECYVFEKTTTSFTVTLVNSASGSSSVGGSFRWITIPIPD